jgi:flavin-dependent dehydrogenase
MQEQRGSALLNPAIHISGAGPSGLAAAITIAKRGGRAIVYERSPDVGNRFHGDFQGLENWTTSRDVLEELHSLGIEPTFAHAPFHEVVVYGPAGREYTFRSSQPLLYLVRRGPHPGMLDASLRDQALACGVEIRFGNPCQHLPQGGIIAQGPRTTDAVALGYVFETDMADGVFGVVSDEFAPKGYSYLLVHNGFGTIAATIFQDFPNGKKHLEATVKFFQGKTGLTMRNPRHFSGTGSFGVPQSARRGNTLFAGEAAAFQDALWGFGIRYAIVSGHLAARALLERVPEQYDRLWKRRFGGMLRASFVNRYRFERFGDLGYTKLLTLMDHSRNVRAWLRRYYSFTFWKRLLYPFARRSLLHSKKQPSAATV